MFWEKHDFFKEKGLIQAWLVTILNYGIADIFIMFGLLSAPLLYNQKYSKILLSLAKICY